MSIYSYLLIRKWKFIHFIVFLATTISFAQVQIFEAQPEQVEVVNSILASIKSTDRALTPETQNALLRAGKASISGLIQLMKHPSVTVRYRAAYILGKIGYPSKDAIAELKAIALDSNDPVRFAAFNSLRRLLRFANPDQGQGTIALNPEVLRRNDPKYPLKARIRAIQGKVTLQATVKENGKVRDIKILESLEESCDKAAINALNKWRFKPGSIDGHPVDVEITLAIQFVLR